MREAKRQISCSTHGQQVATFVCRHLLSGFAQGFSVGFDEDYPDDPYPNAWCDRCEAVVQESGQWDEESESFAGIKLICSNCYLEARLRNEPEVKRRRYHFGGLENVELSHLAQPRSFSIPRSDERGNLKIGQLVKLFFKISEAEEGAPSVERMWVELTELDSGRYKGLLNNDPAFIGDLECGDSIEFGPEHVSAVYCSADQQGWIDERQVLKVSAQVVHEDAWPSYAERNDASGNFSGWTILKDSAEPKDNLLELSIAEILRRFLILDSILGEEQGSRWQWSDEHKEFRRIENGFKNSERSQ